MCDIHNFYELYTLFRETISMLAYESTNPSAVYEKAESVVKSDKKHTKIARLGFILPRKPSNFCKLLSPICV